LGIVNLIHTQLSSDPFGNVDSTRSRKHNPYFIENILCRDEFIQTEIISWDYRVVPAIGSHRKLKLGGYANYPCQHLWYKWDGSPVIMLFNWWQNLPTTAAVYRHGHRVSSHVTGTAIVYQVTWLTRSNTCIDLVSMCLCFDKLLLSSRMLFNVHCRQIRIVSFSWTLATSLAIIPEEIALTVASRRMSVAPVNRAASNTRNMSGRHGSMFYGRTTFVEGKSSVTLRNSYLQGDADFLFLAAAKDCRILFPAVKSVGRGDVGSWRFLVSMP